MKFEELLKRYKNGTATAEEMAVVEEELEKVRLIEEYLAEEDSAPPLPEVAAAGEVKAVQRTINRRTRRSASAVVAGVLALVALLQYVLLPLANRRVFDEPDYDNGNLSEYELFMDTITHLCIPFYNYYGTEKTTTGFGQWTLTNTFWGLNRQRRTPDFTLTCGSLDPHANGDVMWQLFPTVNVFDITDSYQQRGYDTGDHALARLDDSINVAAAVSFNRELTLEEVLALRQQYSDLTVWSAALTPQYSRPIHLTFAHNGLGWGSDANKDYPLLWVSDPAEMTADMWQHHLESQLQFVVDHRRLLNKFDALANSYQYLLADVQKGATFKGVWVIGTGAELLSLYESGVVGDIWCMDAYIAL